MKINHVLLKIVIGLLLLFTLVSFAIAPVVATGTVYYDKTRNYDQSQFFVKYDVNSSFTLPTGWVKVQDFKSLPGLIVVETPANTTVKDAMDYICSLDGVIYTEPNYISSTIPKETDSKKIYSGTRTDRITVFYNESETERLPWDVVYVFDKNSSLVGTTGELVSIPNGMSLVDAIYYCDNCSYVYGTSPGDEYVQSVVLGNGKDLDILTDVILVEYDKNSSYRLNWTINEDIDYVFKSYKVPEGMTLAEAYAYCNTIDDIVLVGFLPKMYPSSSVSLETPFPFVGFFIGTILSSIVLIRRKDR